MPSMYFSGEKGEHITFDDPDNHCMRINPEIYARSKLGYEQNARIFLDTHLLRIHSLASYVLGDDLSIERTSLVSKNDASVSLETRSLIPALVYVSNSITTAEFREMSSDEFKSAYLAPVDDALRESKISFSYLWQDYSYEFGNPRITEDDIQLYFSQVIAGSISALYHEIYGRPRNHYFARSYSGFRAPLNTSTVIKPNAIHYTCGTDPSSRHLDICYAIGDFENEDYYFTKGFEELKMAISENKKNLPKQRTLGQPLNHALFNDREWSPRVLCALVLRKHIYQAFLCGTDRVFISDHQSFSGFFRYELVDGERMIINYYVINDPETVEHGITLRSAITGFFYKPEADALATTHRLNEVLKIARKTKGSDPFANVLPRPVEEPSRKRKLSKSFGSALGSQLISIEEHAEEDDFDEIHGNTYCRIVYDAPKCYPGLVSILPTDVFTKVYNYPDLAFENFPEKDDYYDMFVNELEINKIIENSQFASNFPRLIVSGYLNGMPSKPMHIFEDLGEEVPMSEWDYDQVYDAIKLRLKELHHLGISHNDVRIANFVVSETGKISLIDFGLSTCPTSEKRQKRDLEALDQCFRKGSYGVNEGNEDDLEDMSSEKAHSNNSRSRSGGNDI